MRILAGLALLLALFLSAAKNPLGQPVPISA